eukprot:COSAG02_NODE_1678_length_11359_cov_7.398224_9_plen_48_part_00
MPKKARQNSRKTAAADESDEVDEAFEPSESSDESDVRDSVYTLARAR